MPLGTAESPLFDPIAIERLRQVAGDQGSSFVKEMAELFLEETQKTLGELREGCHQGDRKLVTRLAHSLKSSAATLGLMRLSSACKALELDATNSTFGAETEALRTSVVDQFDRAIPVLKSLAS